MNDDFIDIRYASLPFSDVDDEFGAYCDFRQQRLWTTLTEITNSAAQEPITWVVHSPQALPAFVGDNTSPFALVWDAGLGTILDRFAFLLPYAQPDDVAEAITRQVVALRALLCGRMEQATAQSSEAVRLLTETPIDRRFQQRVDADAQFEVYLTTELQEEFILAHELAHHLSAVDASAFAKFEQCVTEILASDETASWSTEHHKGLSKQDERSSPPIGYEWFLHHAESPTTIYSTAPANYREEFRAARAHFLLMPDGVREELLCDLLGGTAVALWAHRHARGWTAAAAVSSAAIALSGLRVLTTIDSWLAGQGGHPAHSMDVDSERDRFMCALLPPLLHRLKTRDDAPLPDIDVMHDAMRAARARYAQVLSRGLSRLSQFTDSDVSHSASAATIMVLSGFQGPLRPDARGTVVNRVANRFLFDLGVVTRTQGIHGLEMGRAGFVGRLDEVLLRHQRGDWGDVCDEDAQANYSALFEEWQTPSAERLRRRGSLYSSYVVDGETVLIKTAADRRATTIYLMWEM